MRDIAAARYKRNHLFLEDLFSSHTASEVVMNTKQQFESGEKRKQLAEMKVKAKQETEREIERLKKEHEQKIRAVRERSKEMLQRISMLSKCRTEQVFHSIESNTCSNIS